MADSINPDNIPIPSVDKIVEVIQSMGDISDEEKNALLREVMGGNFHKKMEEIVAPTAAASAGLGYQMFTLLGLILVIGLIFALFGYKLYKSLMERKQKQEEKKKLKQLKKKK